MFLKNNKFKIIIALAFVLALCTVFLCYGCKNNDKPSSEQSEESTVESTSEARVTVTLGKTSLDLVKYETAVITAVASDGSAVTFSSSNDSVASVTEDGVVTAKSVGTCDIIAAAKNASAKCMVVVSDSPYSAKIKGINDEIRVVKGGEFKAKPYADFNGVTIEDNIDYSVSLTNNAEEGIANAAIDENGMLVISGVKAGTTSFSVFAEIRGSLTVKTFTVVVYANEIVVEPENESDFERLDGGYGVTLITENGESGLSDTVNLNFDVQVNGGKISSAKVEFDVNDDYNSEFDAAKVQITGSASDGYTLTALARGVTFITGKYVYGGETTTVKIRVNVVLPERQIAEKLTIGRENGSITLPDALIGNLEEITLNGNTVSTAINGKTASFDKDLIPNGGNSLVSAKLTVYTDKYCYNANVDICTKILTSATDFDAFKMVAGAYRAFNGYYMLTGDVDFVDYGTCTAIRDNSNPSNASTGFKGVLDGNGYKIKNITVGSGGIFGHVGSEAVIKNITFDNVHYLNISNSTLFAHTIRGAELENIVVNVGQYDIEYSASTRYDVGLLSSRFLMESKLKNVTINAAGATILNLFGHKCVTNEFENVKITAAAYRYIGCNSDRAAEDTEIKELPKGITFTAK